MRDIGKHLDIPKSTVHNVIVRFKETGVNERRIGSGRPRTARTAKHTKNQGKNQEKSKQSEKHVQEDG